MLLFEICLILCACVIASNAGPTGGPNNDYFHMDAMGGNNEFGYDTGKNGSFHFQNQSPEGFSSGCYGRNGNGSQWIQVTHYIVDAGGFRLVQPNLPAAVLLEKDNTTAQIRTWQQLAMPEGCTKNTVQSTANVQSDVPSGPLNTPAATAPDSVNVPIGVVHGLITVVNSLVSANAHANVNSPSGVQNDLGLGGILNLPISLLNGLLGIVNGVLGGLTASINISG